MTDRALRRLVDLTAPMFVMGGGFSLGYLIGAEPQDPDIRAVLMLPIVWSLFAAAISWAPRR